MTELNYELFGLVTRPVTRDAVIALSAVIRMTADADGLLRVGSEGSRANSCHRYRL